MPREFVTNSNWYRMKTNKLMKGTFKLIAIFGVSHINSIILEQMGKRYLPVLLRNRCYKLYEEDFKTIRCFKKRQHPPVPSFKESFGNSCMEEMEVFDK